MIPRNKVFFVFFFSLAMLLASTSCNAKSDTFQNAKYIPIQHGGRVQPFDSFARGVLKQISGSDTWQGKPATQVLWNALSDRAKINSLEWIRVDYWELKNTLGLDPNRHFFSLLEINPARGKIERLVQSSQNKRAEDMRPSRLEQKAAALYGAMDAVEKLSSGNYEEVIKLPPSRDIKIRLEVFYFDVKPFEWAAFFYLLGFLFFTFFKRVKFSKPLAFFCVVSALLFHTLGLGLRVYILSRPPVSNMYESMIYMNWALMIFASVFVAWKKSLLPLGAGALVSSLVMIYANLLPIDSSLDVLVPVLRSNYWLSIHVMTVVSSYGAFGLAMALGHRHLFLTALAKKFTKKAEMESAELIYKVIQLGTLLIGTGTVLGGVWANESWGRFWGWDPKETWALITFLGYLAVIHLKYAKKLSNFALAMCAVLGFLLVLMTWYGVNFVLGRGLHSYGQGSGGMIWVIYYLIFEACFVGFVMVKKMNF